MAAATSATPMMTPTATAALAPSVRPEDDPSLSDAKELPPAGPVELLPPPIWPALPPLLLLLLELELEPAPTGPVDEDEEDEEEDELDDETPVDEDDEDEDEEGTTGTAVIVKVKGVTTTFSKRASPLA